jgi:glycerol-3-phosphate dehydrogenase
MSAEWSQSDRTRTLVTAERDGVDLLVIGGGITGAGVVRDAASRGLRTLLVERQDFASGTSSRSSKMVHGGMRYIREGKLQLTREACRERDLLARLNPQLVRPLPFLFPAYRGSKMPLWQVRAALLIYGGLANFRKSARSRMLNADDAASFAPELRREGLRGAGLYQDGQVDDARLVLESLKSARALGGGVVNHAELVRFDRDVGGRIEAAGICDLPTGRIHTIRAGAFVNATGPAVERVRGLDRKVTKPELRPAKGVHLVIPRDRIRTEGAVVMEACDGRHIFLCPWEDVALVGTTDAFSHEIDEPVVRIEEVHYLLSAVNHAFPRAALTTNDLRSVFAGVRPLAADPQETTPSASVSREHRIYENGSGLISLVGGKLTTYRSMAERLVNLVVARLPAERRAALSESRTAELPLRDDDFDPAELEARLRRRFGVAKRSAAHLVRTYGASAEELLDAGRPEDREPIGDTRYLYAEIPWSFRTECPVTLCDLLEHRIRLAIFGDGQGLPQLTRIAALAAEAAGWDAERRESEASAYLATLRRRYQIIASGPGAASEATAA